MVSTLEPPATMTGSRSATNLKSNRSASDLAKKYFAAGQKTNEAFAEMMKHTPPSPFSLFVGKHKIWIGLIAPELVALMIWIPLAIKHDVFHLFPKHWDIILVTLVGSFVGGATAEGSGAISFPIQTLVLHTPPTVARDFSAMMQTVGMSSAAVSVQIMGVLIERHTLLFASIGGFLGTALSIEFLEPNMSAVMKKMVFVSVFFSFAMALYLLNREKKRTTYDQIENFDLKKTIVLLCTGFTGGLFAGIGGSGIDIFSFSVITLLYRVNEKVATPTTVSLAGINSAFTFFWTNFIQEIIEKESWETFAVCVPVTCFMSSLGVLTSSILHRLTLACFIYVLETAALIGAIFILQPSWAVLVFCACLICACFGFYFTLTFLGKKMLASNTATVTPAMSTPKLPPRTLEDVTEEIAREPRRDIEQA